MTPIIKPSSAAEILDAVHTALSAETPLELVSAGSKRGLGRPVQAAATLDLSGLAGITLYEPEELVMTAGPGTKLSEIAAALAERNQHLAFEPPDLGPLLGAPAGQGTLGGVFGCGLSGPRRIKAGAARDHLLGLAAVSGLGEEFKAGGRVVKNVTGYDLPKLLTGSYGTLAAFTSLTVKVLPAPEAVRTVLVFGLDDARGIEALTFALQSPYEVSGAAHLPPGPAARSGVAAVRDAGAAVTAVRVEGFGPSVAFRGDWLKDKLAAFGPVAVLETEASLTLWQELRDVRPFAGAGDDRLVWRLSVPPAGGPGLVAALPAALRTAGEHFFDWGGGLIWLAVPAESAAGDGGAAAVRRAVAEAGGGHATLIRAPVPLRSAVPVFQPQPIALAALAARVKQSFDPKGILTPGRMAAVTAAVGNSTTRSPLVDSTGACGQPPPFEMLPPLG